MREGAGARIARLLDAWAGAGLFSGALLAARGPCILFRGGRGLADRARGVANDTNIPVRIGSITKQLTSVLALQGASAGMLDLDEPVAARLGRRLPVLRSVPLCRITPRHLLTHRAGLPDHADAPGFAPAWLSRAHTPRSYLRRFAPAAAAREPGAARRYSGPGFHLLGWWLEDALGAPYAALLRARILEPAGMAATALDAEVPAGPRVRGYESGTLRPAPVRHPSTTFAAAGVVSTLEDLHRWGEALRRGAVLERAWVERILAGDDGAYGWEVRWPRMGPGGAPTRIAKHYGVCEGVNTVLVWMVDAGAWVAAYHNHGLTHLRELCIEVERILLDAGDGDGHPPGDRRDDPPPEQPYGDGG